MCVETLVSWRFLEDWKRKEKENEWLFSTLIYIYIRPHEEEMAKMPFLKMLKFADRGL